MSSPQVEIMGQVKSMTDVITTIAIGNISQSVGSGKLQLSSDEIEMIASIIRASAEQGFSNASTSLVRTIDRRLKA